jgi:hypothetical protein
MHRLMVGVGIVIAWVRAASGAVDCADARVIHAFDPALSPGRCVPVAQLAVNAQLGPSVLQVVQLESMHEDTAAALRDLQGLVPRVVAAADALGVPTPDQVTILLDARPPAVETRAASFPGRIENECTIAYHFTEVTPRKLFQVAHELFHCVQRKLWDDARLGSTGADWWAEGSAELFASLAFPGSGLTDGDVATFGANESAVLIDRSYDAVVFFYWFLGAKGAGELMTLLDAVQDKAGVPVITELHGSVPLDDWLEFEQAYYDRRIHEAGGGRVLPISDGQKPPVTRIDASGIHTFSAEPYVVRRAVVEFAEGKRYELDRHDQPEKLRMHWSEDGGIWAPPPPEVRPCHGTRRYRAVVGTVEASLTLRLRVTARDDRDCLCIIGGWVQTPESIARRTVRGSGNARCAAVQGTTRLDLRSDHTGSETYLSLQYECHLSSGQIVSTANGAFTGTWTTIDDQLHLSYNGSTAVQHMHMTIRGHTTDLDKAMSKTGGSQGSARFRCKRESLHLELGAEAYDYTRVATPLEPEPVRPSAP